MEMVKNSIYLGDCLELMKKIPDKSIDMILCDLPYGTTACKWDTIIPFEPLWEQYKRIVKDNGAIVLTASQPFTSSLVMSNPKMFKYCWVWNKGLSGSPAVAKYRPLPISEDILVFGDGKVLYNPQMRKGKMRVKGRKTNGNTGEDVSENWKGLKNGHYSVNDDYFPVNILDITNANRRDKSHPTQKPVTLFEYLIKTYTNEGDLVLDNCAGSFTTAIAAINTNRNYICMEKDETYFNIGKDRIEKHLTDRNSKIF